MIPEKNVAYLQKALDGDVQAAYAKHARHEDLFDFFAVWERTGVRMDEKAAQKAYERFIRHGWVDGAKSLKEITKLDLNANKKTVQKGYDYCIGKGQFGGVIDLKEYTGINPGEESIQKAYEVYFKDKHPAGPKMIKELTGVPPSPALLRKYKINPEEFE